MFIKDDRNSVNADSQSSRPKPGTALVDKACIGFMDKCSKQAALNSLVDLIGKSKDVSDVDEVRTAIFHRETLMSTGIGLGLAFPHARLSSVKKPAMAVGLCREGIDDYESLDNAAVHLVFMIVAGKDQHAQYLRLLASISKKLKVENVRKSLINAPDEDSFYALLKEMGI
ncbi:EIIABC-Fru [Anaerohalosphaera lusitana]|uniref:EIIABC-Fru n=1 Tax=Anaerohalosphaera lusitana TaxID=1936003 RepID=A0A1U9NLA8_9BACT|nr:PTS sugar transporter subunit IIA [Anaerohalosphaera lusitana]AQT68615.1 EIIABC-Fru [Anaerohalosphaera lusitana]